MARIAATPRVAMLALATPVALLLAWRVIVAGMDAYAERSAASGVQSVGGPTALDEASLRQRLARNPADATGLLLLALELERQGRREEAGAAMRMAVRLAPADPQTLLLVAGYSLRMGDEAQALSTLRRAVDSSSDVGGRVWPVFAQALATGRHRAFFDKVARDNPSWWLEFWSYACAQAPSAAALQAVFAARVGADVATPGERRGLTERLLREAQWTDAYLTWLNGLPVDQRQRVGYVFNGNFELPLTNDGFDWRIPSQEGAIVLADPGDGGPRSRTLSVAFSNQRYAGPPVYQYLLLPRGRYRLEGKVRSDLNAWLGLQWGVYCQKARGQETQLVHTEPVAGTTTWREFHADFAVSADCPAQMLRLELANPKQAAGVAGAVAIRLKGKVAFDDIRVRIID